MFLLAILSIFQVGCYEDKGNYDYTTVDEVTIEGEYELVYRLKMGERLSIPMTLELNGFDESQLEFKWEFAIQNKLNPEYHLLSTSKDFDEEITLAPANYDLRYSIMNTATGLTTYKRFNVEVTDAISKYTYLLLCKVPGTTNEYDLSSANEFSRIGEPLYNLYSKTNGKNIQNAKSLFYFATSSSPYYDNCLVLKNDGAEKLSPFDLTWVADQSELFFEPKASCDIEFLLTDKNFSQYFIVADGKLHFCTTRYTPYKFGVEKSLPDNSDYYISNYGYFYDYYGSKYVFLDRKGGRFLLWENGAMNLSIVSSNQYYTIGELKDFSTLYMGQSCKKTLFALMKDQAGKVHKYDFGTDYTSGYPYKYVVLGHSVIPDEVELDKASAVYPHPNSENIFYAVKDKIWLLNTATNTRILFHDFKDPDVNVVEMHIKDAYAYMMFIALNKGDKGYVYRFWISSNGMPQDPAEGLFPLPKEDDMTVPYEAMGPYDEIVDMEYKSKTW